MEPQVMHQVNSADILWTFVDIYGYFTDIAQRWSIDQRKYLCIISKDEKGDDG